MRESSEEGALQCLQARKPQSGLVSIGDSRPKKACFVIYDNAYGFYFGMVPLGAGLKLKAHHMDFIIPVEEVTALYIGGASKKTVSLYAGSPRLHLQTGRAFLQITSQGREAVQFAPTDTVSISDTGIMASKILAGRRTVYSKTVRGDDKLPARDLLPPQAPTPSTEHTESIGHGPEQVLPSASRYFPTDSFDIGLKSYVIPCQRDVQRDPYLLPGYLVFEQRNWGFFEPEDIEEPFTSERSPLNELVHCGVGLPDGVTIVAPEDVSLSSTESQIGSITLALDTWSLNEEFWIDYGSDKDRAATVMVLEAVLERIGEQAELQNWDD